MAMTWQMMHCVKGTPKVVKRKCIEEAEAVQTGFFKICKWRLINCSKRATLLMHFILGFFQFKPPYNSMHYWLCGPDGFIVS